jgi:hypothetical protein
MTRRPIRALALPVLAVAVLIGCVGQAGPGAPESVSPAGTGTLTIPPATVTAIASPSVEAVASPSVEAVHPHVPSTCHLTTPINPFVPPAEYPAPARPPDYYDAEWYGNARLWTMVRHGGEIWFALPRGPAGFGQKTFWWSAEFDVSQEQEPAISVTGKRLDRPGRFVSPAPGTNAAADFGSAMLIGVDIPTTGCWMITASYRHASLSFIAWVGN